MAFAPTITPLATLHHPAAATSSSSQLRVAVDPSVASKKEYQDVCGNIFGEDEMMSRLQKTNYLYPRHVEVIEDLSEMAGEMTDKIVSVLPGLNLDLVPYSPAPPIRDSCLVLAL